MFEGYNTFVINILKSSLAATLAAFFDSILAIIFGLDTGN